MTTVALIPARGGSKGIPNKNLRSLCGRPLIAWTIDQARSSRSIDQVVVSTDDDQIAEISLEWGASVPFMRPDNLAGDESTTESVLTHALQMLDSMGDTFERAVLLQPTSPIRSSGTIDRALSLFELSQADSLVSVQELPPFVWRSGKYFSAQYDPMLRPRRQDLVRADRLYVENGSIYISKVSAILESGCRVSGNVIGFTMTRAESIDIDEETDFVLAESIIAGLGMNS